jgi:hypothetical protein
MGLSIIQTVDESVEVYIRKILKEQANVDAECRLGHSVVHNRQLSKIPLQVI